VTFKKYEDISLYGSTGLSSKDLFRQRRGYDVFYPTATDPLFPKPINFRDSQQSRYGAMSSNKEYMIPDTAYFKQLVGTKETLFALNFVADAYEELSFYMKTKGIIKMMEDSGRLKMDMSAKKAWTNSDGVFSQIQEGLYDSFNETFLDIQTRAMVKDFESFMDVFMNFYLNFLEFDIPVTYTGMLQSSFYNPMFSGLCIELENLDHDSDYEKFDKYVNNKNFKEYATAAASFGFMLDQHAPWRLVANINSPRMKKYIGNYIRLYRLSREGLTEYTTVPYLEDGSTHAHKYFIDENGNGFTDSHGSPKNITKEHSHQIINYRIVPSATPKGNDPNVGIEPHIHQLQILNTTPWSNEDFYNEYYYRTQDMDIENLKNMMFDFYERFATNFPQVSIPKPCQTSKDIKDFYNTNFFYDPLQVSKVYRNKISREDFDQQYDDLFWYKTYFLVRLRELKQNISSAKVKNSLAKIENLYLNLDKESSLSYIQQYLKQYY